MEFDYTIKNFRIFDEAGSHFSLKPITLLTGTNSCGKSSLVKSILLFKGYTDFIKQRFRQKGHDLGAGNLDFLCDGMNINGIDSVINRKAKDNKEVSFTISYAPVSESVKYTAEYVFGPKDGDPFNNGWLKRFNVSCNSRLFLQVEWEDEAHEYVKHFHVPEMVIRDFIRCVEIDRIYKYEEAILNRLMWREDIAWKENKFCVFCDRLFADPLNNSLRGRMLKDCCRWKWWSPKLPEEVQVLRVPEAEKTIPSFSWYSEEALEKFKENGVLTYFPILDTIDGMSPDKILEYCRSLSCHDKEHYPMSAEEDLIQILVKYRRSGCESFIDYYRKMEQDFLSVDMADICWGRLYYPNSETFIDCTLNPMLDIYVFGKEGLEPKYSISEEMPGYEFFRLYSTIQSYQDFTLRYIEKNTDFKDSAFVRWEKDYSLTNIPTPYIFRLFRQYLTSVIRHLLMPEDLDIVKYVGSFICPIQRSYPLSDSTNPISSLLKEYLESKFQFECRHEEKYKPNSFTNKWIKRLAIGRRIKIEKNEDNDSVRLFIMNQNGGKVSSADMGHGVTQILSILLHIECLLLQGARGATLCLEEPEVSLHPSYQSELTRIFKDAYDTYGIHFIIETHSEYLIRASQTMVAKECNDSQYLKDFPFAVYYMNQDGTAYELEYLVSGRFNNSFGTGFFDESTRSSIEILKKERALRNDKHGKLS